MEIGTENRKKVYWASGLGVVALVLLANWLFSPGSSTSVAATPAKGASRPVAPVNGATLASSIDPTLRFDWLKESEDTQYEGNNRNIFVPGAEPPPVPLGNGTTDHVAETQQPPPPPPGPPPPPPINLKFYGFASKQGEPKKVFLSEGEDVWVAGEGDIIDRRYKILRIMPMSVEVEDVLNNNRQQIPLTQS